MRRVLLYSAALAALGVSILGFSSATEQGKKPDTSPKHAVAVLSPTKGNNVQGAVRLTQHDGYVHLQGEVRNLTPGKHGFHIHEFGDLRDPEGKSAGDHFNPEGHPHGGPNDPKRHAGDLGNIVANDKGIADVNVKAQGLKLHLVVGRALVVHAGADDLKSQPSGDAGPRVALGVIGLAKTTAKAKP